MSNPDEVIEKIDKLTERMEVSFGDDEELDEADATNFDIKVTEEIEYTVLFEVPGIADTLRKALKNLDSIRGFKIKRVIDMSADGVGVVMIPPSRRDTDKEYVRKVMKEWLGEYAKSHEMVRNR